MMGEKRIQARAGGPGSHGSGEVNRQQIRGPNRQKEGGQCELLKKILPNSSLLFTEISPTCP